MGCENCPFDICGNVLAASIVRKLARDRGTNTKDACGIVADIVNKVGSEETAEIYRIAFSGYGRSKNHCSGMVEGEQRKHDGSGPRGSRTSKRPSRPIRFDR